MLCQAEQPDHLKVVDSIIGCADHFVSQFLCGMGSASTATPRLPLWKATLATRARSTTVSSVWILWIVFRVQVFCALPALVPITHER